MSKFETAYDTDHAYQPGDFDDVLQYAPEQSARRLRKAQYGLGSSVAGETVDRPTRATDSDAEAEARRALQESMDLRD